MLDYTSENNPFKQNDTASRTNSLSDLSDISNEILEDHINKKKYSFDVVDQFNDPLHITEKEESGNFSYDDTIHKRIVRVSLHKANRRNQEACFRGNDSYVLHDTQKFINTAERYQNNINIRFKTSFSNGLLLLIYQKAVNNIENIFSLTIEDG